jgi:hypothetical protein
LKILRTALAALLATALFVSSALGQNAGSVTNHAFAIGKGTGVTGYTSLLCGAGQLAVAQAGADPICRTVSGDWTLNAAGVSTLATVNANVGAFGSASQCPSFTVNGKGLITAASQTACVPTAVPLANITGLGTGVQTALGLNIGSAGAPLVFNGALGTPTSGSAANLTLGANQVTRANMAQGIARSVIGVAGNGTANVADIQGTTANTFLGVNSAGNGIGFQSLRQILPFSMSTVPLPQASTLFTMYLGNATEANVSVSCPLSGTFRNLFVFSTAPAAGQTLTATLRVAGADTALTCTITGPSTTCSDVTHTAACTAGNLFVMKLVTSATTGSLAAVGGGLEYDTP